MSQVRVLYEIGGNPSLASVLTVLFPIWRSQLSWLEHLMLLCQMFYSSVGDRQSYFGLLNQWSQVRVLYSSLNAVQCTLDFHQFEFDNSCGQYYMLLSLMAFLTAFHNMGMQLNKFILLCLFSGKAVVFIRVTSVIALVLGTKVYWFESNHPRKNRGWCMQWLLQYDYILYLNLTPTDITD